MVVVPMEEGLGELFGVGSLGVVVILFDMLCYYTMVVGD
jgi:hypothetical protein